ncbi:hypothetical protein [Pseudonocardia phyllosphaerae]|uniref:hypothetical protein n=1 Tax=Pseudonocardia phyllosphaerae TaxID=3390502 RepID=UPI003977F8CF
MTAPTTASTGTADDTTPALRAVPEITDAPEVPAQRTHRGAVRGHRAAAGELAALAFQPVVALVPVSRRVGAAPVPQPRPAQD